MSMQPSQEKARRPWWVLSTYFAEGFPYGLVRMMSTAYFKEHGASLEAIGLTSLLGIPWTIKFLWAPLIDGFGTKRRWLLVFELAVVIGLAALGLASTTASPLVVGSVVFMAIAFLAASHDIAIDGYYLEALDRTGQARWVGLQSAAYRVAMVAGSGGIAWICGRFSWLLGYSVAAAFLGGIWLLHALRLPHGEMAREPMSGLGRYLGRPRTILVATGAALLIILLDWGLRRPEVAPLKEALGWLSMPRLIVLALLVALLVLAVRAPVLKRRLYASDSHYAAAFVNYLDRPKAGVILAFIVTYRIGESLVQNMAYPFLKDIGISLAQYAIAHNTVGVTATIAGGIVGGLLIARYDLWRCIWPFVLLLNSLNLLYMFLAIRYRTVLADPDVGRADFGLVLALITVEAFGAGFGNAAFMVFIMRTARARFKAAHFAIGTGVMNVAGTLAGVVSGFVAARVGFAVYFGLTAVLTIPNMVLIPFLPYLRLEEVQQDDLAGGGVPG
jgi:PAT family beta-lactamase induction signal transducer AmpG